MLANAVCACVIDDASPEPLVGPGAQDVIPTIFQIRLQSKEEGPRKNVAETPVAVLPLHLATDELLGAAHVQRSIHAEVIHQGFDSVRLCVGVILDQVKPVVFVDVVVQNVFDALKHVPDRPLIPVGDHEHGMRDFAISRAGEKDDVVQVVAYGAIDGHA